MRLVVIAAVVALAGQVARAQGPGPTAGAPPGLTPVTQPVTQPATPWVPSYRSQTLVADGVATTLFIAAFALDDRGASGAAGMLGIATYAFAAPLVHASKHRGHRGLASLGLRIALPVVGGLVGEGLHHEPSCAVDENACGREGPSDDAALGVLAGMLAASAIDAIVLAKGDAPRTSDRSWTPTARATPGGVTLGVLGSF